MKNSDILNFQSCKLLNLCLYAYKRLNDILLIIINPSLHTKIF